VQIPAVRVPHSDALLHPIRNHFGLRSFGINAYVAGHAGDRIIGEHDHADPDDEKHEELYFVHTGAARFVVDGEVIEATKPHKLVTSWRATWAEALAAEPYSRVTWEIESTGDGVSKLTVVHDKLDESPATAESVAGGWSYVLSGMKSVVETGKALEE